MIAAEHHVAGLEGYGEAWGRADQKLCSIWAL